jgi:predicted N-acetyltransferase YhbS
MNDISFTILPETEADALAIERLHERTFGPGRYAKTAYRLRERGVGQALIDRALAAAKAKGHRLVVLVGDEPYYAKCGFRRIAKKQVAMPGPVDPARLLVAELIEGAFEGVSGTIEPDWDAARS